MSDVVRDAIATELALVQRIAPAPLAPFGYGSDLSCAGDLTPTMESVDPFSTRAIAESILRELDTPRGGLVDDPDYGLDLRGAVNRGMTAADVRSLAERVRTVAEKDDRVSRASVTVSPSPTGTTLRVEIRVTPVGALNPFRLTLAATSADVLIEELRS